MGFFAHTKMADGVVKVHEVEERVQLLPEEDESTVDPEYIRAFIEEGRLQQAQQYERHIHFRSPWCVAFVDSIFDTSLLWIPYLSSALPKNEVVEVVKGLAKEKKWRRVHLINLNDIDFSGGYIEI